MKTGDERMVCIWHLWINVSEKRVKYNAPETSLNHEGALLENWSLAFTLLV